MSDPAVPDSFIAKWRARWPEWAVAEVFVPVAQRERVVAWFALLQELVDAAWAGDDPTPGQAKLGWWQEELQGWALGRRRHPLGELLQRQPAPWGRLATALPSLSASRELPPDLVSAQAALAVFADTVAAIEHVLFAGEGDAGGAGAVTASLLATHPPWPVEAADRRRELLAAWPRREGSRPRRIAAALARARLASGVPPRAVPAWRVLWLSWNAARH